MPWPRQAAAAASKLSAEHRAVLDDLKNRRRLPSTDYIEVRYCTSNDRLSGAEAGDNARLQFFAQEMLPTLQSHLDQVGKMR